MFMLVNVTQIARYVDCTPKIDGMVLFFNANKDLAKIKSIIIF